MRRQPLVRFNTAALLSCLMSGILAAYPATATLPDAPAPRAAEPVPAPTLMPDTVTASRPRAFGCSVVGTGWTSAKPSTPAGSSGPPA